MYQDDDICYCSGQNLKHEMFYQKLIITINCSKMWNFFLPIPTIWDQCWKAWLIDWNVDDKFPYKTHALDRWRYRSFVALEFVSGLFQCESPVKISTFIITSTHTHTKYGFARTNFKPNLHVPNMMNNEMLMCRKWWKMQYCRQSM